MLRRPWLIYSHPGRPRDNLFQAEPLRQHHVLQLVCSRHALGTAPFAGPPPGKSGRGPNPSSMDKCCRRVLEPPDTGAISREEIVGPVTGIVKDAGDEEAGQRLKAGATPWRDRDFATRPMA